MPDLIVVGAGFWGTAIALEARSRGLDVLLLDDANPRGASRNAAGLISLEWFRRVYDSAVERMTPHDWSGEREATLGLNWLQSYASVSLVPYERTTHYHPGIWRPLRDIWLLHDPPAFLALGNATQATASQIRPDGADWLVSTDRGPFRAHRLALALGAWTDALLIASALPAVDVRPLRGRALLARPPEGATVSTLRALLVRPYTEYTLRPWPGDQVRIGDTAERRLDRNDAPVHQLEAALDQLLPGAHPTAILDGLRPVCREFTVVSPVPSLVVATGGHRVGLALAGAVALRTLALLGVTSAAVAG